MTQSGPTGSPGPSAAEVVFDDDEYRLAVIDLLGAVAYGELSAFERLAGDPKRAPTMRYKVELGGRGSLEAWRAWSSVTSVGCTTGSAPWAPTRSRRWRRSRRPSTPSTSTPPRRTGTRA